MIPKKLIPKSLLGQVMASAMLALLVAQLVGAFLLYKASNDRLELSALTALSAQLVIGSDNPGRFRPRSINAPLGTGRMPRRLRYRSGPAPAVELTPEATEEDLAERFLDVLEQEGIRPYRAAIELRLARNDPELRALARRRPALRERTRWDHSRIYIASVQRTQQSGWETVRVFERRPPKQAFGILIGQTFLIYAFLGSILYWVLRRITRPLATLTERVDDFTKAPDRAVRLEETGPSDTRRLIAAHNAMEARIAALLDEKDVMLGAIGHDLKTPLAALRVRIESVPDEAQRARMAGSIEDITRTLDDILSLARVGRRGNANGDRTEPVDIRALADSVVEEFEDLGDPVSFDEGDGPTKRLVAHVQVTWLKRALRNLVSNAVRYGGAARVSVSKTRQEGRAFLVLRVEDDGPGIDEDQIANMLEPFTRGEESRNRSTGGAGLGLTLARAIAEAHDGALVLANRRDGETVKGLVAEIRIPEQDESFAP